MIMPRTIAGLALLLAAPATAQTDGTLGPTSSGSFTINAIYTQPPVDNVQVYGLDDVTFNEELGNLVLPSQQMIFCMIRESNGGNVGVTVTSTDAADTEFKLTSADPMLGGHLLLDLELQTQGGAPVALAHNVESVFSVPAACMEGDAALDSRLDITINGNPTFPETYSKTFLISIAPK